MTLLLYARRRGWPLDGVTVELSHEPMHTRNRQEGEEHDDTELDVFRRSVVVKGDLTEEQRQRLLAVSRNCPVHRMLERGARILDGMDGGE